MPLDTTHARALLRQADFRSLFIEELGWDRYNATLDVQVQGAPVTLSAIAEKRGMVAYHCATPPGQAVPDYGLRRKVEHQVAKSALEHLIVFTDPGKTTQIWQWVKREPGKPAACREHTYHHSQSGDALLQKLEDIAFSLEEEERLTLTDVTSAARAAFDVERVTKRFYERFKQEHAVFLNFVKGITDIADREWYASVMLNRLMFVYFIQRKGFLDGDTHYLRNRLSQIRKEHGRDKFYSFYRYFLLRLFHEGLGGRERSAELERLLGRIPYLNGGLFDIHELEQPDRYGKDIEIADAAFERVFDYFDQYQWHLDERPLRDDKEINPDVLGYIFEKYVNQKQMGAYYTKEDITEYIGKNTVIPFLFDVARAKCKIAFENPNGPTVWDLLRADPDRYIYPAVRHGITWRYDPAHVRQGEALEQRLELPAEIAAGLNPPTLHQTVGEGRALTLELRKGWNKPAPVEFALPTETWREVVARRKRHDELRAKLAAGEVRDINDLITLNLDVRQFAQDMTENCEGPELLRALWHAIERITILDPTCGSGAFLFAALNILEPLYDACLERMEAFVEDLERSGDKHRPEKYADFRRVLANVEAHPNRRYFILKSIILRNLYGVDIMEEAVEICKLRLFLKLAAQVEPDANAKNVGVEPLPDIDFNIRSGNTLVGYPNYESVKTAIGSKFDLDNVIGNIIEKAAELQQTFDTFRQHQIEGDESPPTEHKQELRRRLKALEIELNRYLGAEYGTKINDRIAFNVWLKSHHPFHWFIEFYGIIAGGGFDVIIGNPPYVEYSKIKGSSYSIPERHFITEESGNLLAYVTERGVSLLGPKGRIGLVLLVSTFSTERMNGLQHLCRKQCQSIWVSNFAWRPSKLFDGSNTINAIMIGSKRANGSPRIFSTKYLKWSSEERNALFAILSYGDASRFVIPGSFPKVADLTYEAILSNIFSQRTPLIQVFSGMNARNVLFYFRGMLYWIKVLDNLPLHKEDGQKKVSSQCKRVLIQNDMPAHAVISILSSSMFFWFYQTYSDCQQINQREFAGFKFDPCDRDTVALTRLGKELMIDYKKNSEVITRHIAKRGVTVKKEYFKINKSKPIIDQIDNVLSQHYRLSEEQLDFIINYDIKYRMGSNSETEEDE